MPAFFNLTAVSIILLGVLDWNTASYKSWMRVIGGLLWVSGMSLAIWAVSCLGLKISSGSSSGLIVHGPYRWTRNPQYLGFMLGLIGWGLMTGSSCTLIAGIAGWIPLYPVPWTEEPWIMETYWNAYNEYKKNKPRFLLKWP